MTMTQTEQPNAPDAQWEAHKMWKTSKKWKCFCNAQKRPRTWSLTISPQRSEDIMTKAQPYSTASPAQNCRCRFSSPALRRQAVFCYRLVVWFDFFRVVCCLGRFFSGGGWRFNSRGAQSARGFTESRITSRTTASQSWELSREYCTTTFVPRLFYSQL